MKSIFAFFMLFSLALCPSLSRAADPWPNIELAAETSPNSDFTLEGWGLAHPDCAEWTNACQICARNAAGTPQCSTPGIACVPEAPICRPVTPKPAPIPEPAPEPKVPPKI